MKLRKEKKLGWRRIYKELKETGYDGISAGSVNYWLYHHGKPRLKEFSEKAKKLTKEKAYILGIIGPGDGYINTEGCEIGLAVTDKDFAQKFKKCLEKVYGFKPKENIAKITGFGKKIRYRISLYSVKAIEDLSRYCKSFKENDWKVPSVIKKSPLCMQAFYTAGFADSQGCVHKREILLASQNKEGLEEIKNLFSNFNIRSTIQRRKDTNILSIHGRTSLEIFAKQINFSIKRKREKLKMILKNYKRYYTPTELVDKLVPKIVNYINSGYSKNKTAKILKISNTAVTNRVRKLGGL